MLGKTKTIIENILLPSNSKYYYGELKGSFNYWRIFIWNIFNPGRLFNRLKYGQLIKSISFRKSLFQKKLNKLNNANVFKNNYSDELLSKKFDNLINKGGVVIENYFSSEKIEKFLNKHQFEIEKIKYYDPHNSAGNNQDNLLLTDELLELWLDPRLMLMISSFHNRDVLARYYPNIIYTVCKEDLGSREIFERKIKTNVAEFWHADHSVLFNLHILLDDIDEKDSHMQFIPRSQKYLNSSYSYSDEVVEELGIDPVKCVGKKGTVYMHGGNTLHKLRMINSKKNRLVLHLEFTAGSNILLDCNVISKCLANGFDLNKISSDQRNILKGIFPKSFPKGYEIDKNEVIYPTKFKGI